MNVNFDELCEKYMFGFLREYAKILGEPIKPSKEEVENKLIGYEKDSSISFYFTIDLRANQHRIQQIRGLDSALDLPGQEETILASPDSLKEFLNLIHKDYIELFLKAAYAGNKSAQEFNQSIVPFEQSFRISIPLKMGEGYFWYLQDSTAIEVDSNNYMVTQINKYSPHIRVEKDDPRRIETCFTDNGKPVEEWNKRVFELAKESILSTFDNLELDILTKYNNGLNTNEIVGLAYQSESWVRNTNSTICKKAKYLFAREFRSAKSVANYCLNKGYLEGK